jgi:hypothetical protein
MPLQEGSTAAIYNEEHHMPQDKTPEDLSVHDQIVDVLQETQPEGPSPKGSSVQMQNRLLFAFGALGLGAMIIFLFVRGGWAAGSVGLLILFLYAFLGSTPWMAGTLRARDRREVEQVVTHELGIPQTKEPPRTA